MITLVISRLITTSLPALVMGLFMLTTHVAQSTEKSASKENDKSVATQIQNPGFTAEQKAEIGEIAALWLVEHPEYLVAASDRLRQQQELAKHQTLNVLAWQNLNAILDHDAPSVGPESPEAVVAVFSDYQCSDCSLIYNLIKETPNVRFIFRDYPVGEQSLPVYSLASRTGNAVWKNKGGEAYLEYSHAISNLKNSGGKLTEDTLNITSMHFLNEEQMKNSESDENKKSWQQRIEHNIKLTKALQLEQTPAFIVLPASNVSASNITVLTDAVNEEALRQAIIKAQTSSTTSLIPKMPALISHQLTQH